MKDTSKIKNVKSKLSIGDVAPAFRANIAEGQEISLDSLAGKYVVLYFYPKDDTPGCTIEAQDFSELGASFNSHGAIIFGVSKDNLNSHEKFKQKYSLGVGLLSDTDGEICKDYGVLVEKSMFGKKYLGIERTTYLIDPEGKIAFIWPKVSVQGHAFQVLEKIKELTK